MPCRWHARQRHVGVSRRGGISMPARKIANRDASDQELTHPNRARRAVLTGGALSLAAVAGGTLGRPQSASANTTQPVTAILPSGDTSGAADAAAINNAFSTLPTITDPETKQTYRVGSVLLAPADIGTPPDPGIFHIS